VRSNRPWIAACTASSVVAMAMLVAGLAAGSVASLPLGVAAFFAHRRFQRRSLIRRMGPALAASKGELPETSRDNVRFPSAPPALG